jgi:hypothetical protein
MGMWKYVRKKYGFERSWILRRLSLSGATGGITLWWKEEALGGTRRTSVKTSDPLMTCSTFLSVSFTRITIYIYTIST